MQSCLCAMQVRCDVVNFGAISVRYVQLVMKNLVHECRAAVCPVCVRIPELFVRFPTAVLYANKFCVTSHDTSTGLLGTFQASNIGEWYTKKLFRKRSIILAIFHFWWEFPANSGVVHGIFDARRVRLTLVMDVECWQFFFRTVFILILKVRCEFF